MVGCVDLVGDVGGTVGIADGTVGSTLDGVNGVVRRSLAGGIDDILELGRDTGLFSNVVGGFNEWSADGSDCGTVLAISDGKADGLDDDEDERVGDGEGTTVAIVGIVPPIQCTVWYWTDGSIDLCGVAVALYVEGRSRKLSLSSNNSSASTMAQVEEASMS